MIWLQRLVTLDSKLLKLLALHNISMNLLLERVESFLMLAFVVEVKEVSITGEQYIGVIRSRFGHGAIVLEFM
jgi:hypothetical protein